MYQIGQHIKTLRPLELSDESDFEETFFCEGGSTGIITNIGQNRYGDKLIYIKMDLDGKTPILLEREITIDKEYYRDTKINIIIDEI